MAVSRLCLDTTAYSRLMRGQPKLQERLESADEILVPVTVLGELYAGFQGGHRLAENLALLAAFRSQPGVVVVAVTDNVAERYAAIVTSLVLSLLLTGTAGAGAIPAAVLAAVTAWLVTMLIEKRRASTVTAPSG